MRDSCKTDNLALEWWKCVDGLLDSDQREDFCCRAVLYRVQKRPRYMNQSHAHLNALAKQNNVGIIKHHCNTNNDLKHFGLHAKVQNAKFAQVEFCPACLNASVCHLTWGSLLHTTPPVAYPASALCAVSGHKAVLAHTDVPVSHFHNKSTGELLEPQQQQKWVHLCLQTVSAASDPPGCHG